MTGAVHRAFTLIEVNIAILVMAVSVLSVVALYSLGLRENSQSVEDVASAGFADAVFAPLVAGLSATNMTWQNWCEAVPDESDLEDSNGILPNDGNKKRGWSAYVQSIENGSDYLVEKSCNDMAQKKVFNVICNKAPTGFKGEWPSIDSDYSYGLVATRRGSTISLAFRASRRRQQLFAVPLYYTEVHFQGVRQQ